MYNSPYSIAIYTEIFMNQEIAHTSNIAPGDIRMLFSKRNSEHIGSFTNNLNILYYSVVAQDIAFKFFTRKFSCILL